MPDVALECFCCGSTEHFVADCKYQTASREYARKLRLKDEAPSLSKKRADKKYSRSVEKQGHGKGSGTRKPKKHGHAAVYDYDSSSGSETDNISSNIESKKEDNRSLDPEPKMEIVMLSKETIRKSTPSLWAFDTGASSPMIDQLHLFRADFLKPTAKVFIQVGGGELYSRQKGIALVHAEDGSYGYLENVLFVPKLGVKFDLCKENMQRWSQGIL